MAMSPGRPTFSAHSGLPSPALALLVALCLLVRPASAQVEWRQPVFGNHYVSALTYDPVRARTLLFGGAEGRRWFTDTAEWDGTRWRVLTPATTPTARLGPRMVFDSARGRAVLFGGLTLQGSNYVLVNDTWEWDGANWTRRFPATSPSPRDSQMMAYDAGRGRVVLFGGWNLGDTWEWDGTNWSLRSNSGPSPRAGVSMAYDPVRARVVLFGGQTGTNASSNETWEWDGTTWTLRLPTVSPSPRVGAGMTYDSVRGQMVLYGGGGTAGNLVETWLWDGTNWSLATPTVSPGRVSGIQMTFDVARARVVMVLGNAVWEWDGTNWSRAIVVPVGVGFTAVAYDLPRTRTVVFGGAGGQGPPQTWEFDGVHWSQAFPTIIPPYRNSHAMAADLVRGKVVLFGGWQGDLFTLLADTWEWDGTNWTQATPSASPPPRYRHAMAYDLARQRVVLFGGWDASGSRFRADTWEWDGAQWSLRTPARSPSVRGGHSMAYDLARGRTVLFGGWGGNALLVDTWEWDGTNWTDRTTVGGPVAVGTAMAYDWARRRTVVWGGTDALGCNTDTWEWDGGAWYRRLPTAVPDGREGHGMTYDIARGKVVMFGGYVEGFTFTAETWEYGPTNPATLDSFGAGCAGSAGVPGLDGAGSLPWIGATLTLRLTRVPSNAAGLAILGTSRTAWGGVSLPIDLGQVGMPGCQLLVSGDLSLPLAANGGVAELTLPLPNNPWLLGVSLFSQALTVDPLANPAGLASSNGLEARLGGR